MSHFVVLVAVPDGKTLHEVMMPYHEFECTGIDEHIQDIDITEKAKVHGLDYYGLEYRTVSSEDQIDIRGAHKYGYAVVVNGEIVKAIDRTNPNKKWDWYEVGGRWHGFFNGVNQGNKAVFNFEAIRQKHLKNKMDLYSKFHQARSRASVTKSDIESARDTLSGNWKENKVAQKLYTDPIDLAIDSKAFELIGFHLWSSDDAQRLHLSENEYRALHEYDAPIHSIIDLDGKWIEKGDMGWWGMCDNENQDTFNGEHGAFWEFINSLPDDIMLYIIDCHI